MAGPPDDSNFDALNDEDGEPAGEVPPFDAPDLESRDPWESVTDPFKKPHPPVADAVLSFLKSITSVRDVVLPLLPDVDQKYVFADITFQEVLERVARQESQLKARLRHPMPPDKQTDYLKAQRAYDDAQYARRNLPRLYLLGLVADYDAFLAELMAALMKITPELMRTIEKTLTMKALDSMTSLDDARHFLIEREIEDALRQSHADQLKWFEDRKIPNLRKALGPYGEFIEVMERRNLVAHNGARITSRYLQMCDSLGVAVPEYERQVGAELELSEQYLRRATDVVFEVAVRLSQLAWRAVRPHNLREADVVLSRICYVLLVFEEFHLACDLLTFAVHELKKHSSEHETLIFIVNLAQCYRWMGEPDKCEGVLSTEEWSAKSPAFQLSACVLRGQWDEAERLMRQATLANEEAKENFRDWPVYREFRRTPQFRRTYEDLFGEPPPEQ